MSRQKKHARHSRSYALLCGWVRNMKRVTAETGIENPIRAQARLMGVPNYPGGCDMSDSWTSTLTYRRLLGRVGWQFRHAKWLLEKR